MSVGVQCMITMCKCTFAITASAMSIRCCLSSLGTEDPKMHLPTCTPTPICKQPVRETEPMKGEKKNE